MKKPPKSKILIACEYSGIVRDSWIKAGYNAISCDILPSESPGPHYQGNLMDILNDDWNLIIAFPPCTDLSNAQAGPILNQKIADGRSGQALEFIKKIYNAADHICIENPVSGYLNDHFRPYDQIVQPYYFGHNYRKKTCLWLKNLPFLISTCYQEPKYNLVNEGSKRQRTPGLFKKAKDRSKFHTGIADAMVHQWLHLFTN